VLDVAGEDSLYMVMEYCPGGSLMRLVQETHHEKEKVLLLSRSGPQQQQASPEEQSKEGVVAVDPAGGLDEDMARRYFRQLVVGIDYLHRNEIIRSLVFSRRSFMSEVCIKVDAAADGNERGFFFFSDYDIKPDNLLLSSDRKQLKVVDFGISAMFVKPGDDSSSSSSRTMGSPAFLSPELINSAQSASPVSGTAADIWAMGMLHTPCPLFFCFFWLAFFGGGSLIHSYAFVCRRHPVLYAHRFAPIRVGPNHGDVFSDRDASVSVSLSLGDG
jgi:serine/threonine protein kinase